MRKISIDVRIVQTLWFSLAVASLGGTPTKAQVELVDCSLPRVAGLAKCGTLTVFEDREAGVGRTIDLNIVVLSARNGDPETDPVFHLAGGPGQGAASIAFAFQRRAERANRDIVLVDQRGTGQSNPLNCKFEDLGVKVVETLHQKLNDPIGCIESLDADLRLYATHLAMDDLDDVRQALGYDQINLWGTSYGTRAALVYLRRHGEHVRTITLSGMYPPSEPLPLSFSRSAQEALNGLFADCTNDEVCHANFPDPKRQLEGILEQLGRAPVQVTGRAGSRTATFELTRDGLARNIANMLYTTESAATIPFMINEAANGDYTRFANFAVARALSVGTTISDALQVTVVCTEDSWAYTPENIREASEGYFLNGIVTRGLAEDCEQWPIGSVPDDFHEPISSTVSALLISGEFDPITPSWLGEEVHRHLPNSLHVILPKQGHGSNAGCLPRVGRNFINNGTVEGLDVSCIETLQRTRFVVPRR